MKLYKIVLDEGEEAFYVMAKNKYEALGVLFESKNGITEDHLGRLKFGGEVDAKEGAVLS